ncbi:Protein of unknown function [Paramicrobacterium humi]|uniref:DUF2510 domain-containing protein n=1 Tax=Paramicrobacterium humi TaxID=640635 RepID=A0A1H4KSX6_9MICO|nr:DUF2510 domain-containing protein [Microbacterium humi]SEB61640.1 Protein of unknown function [Microbacterium humi]
MDLPLGQPPAWLPDPLDGGRVRWWNGATWSDHVRPAAPEVGVAHATNSAAYAVPAASVEKASRIRLTRWASDAAEHPTADTPRPGFTSRRARREAERARTGSPRQVHEPHPVPDPPGAPPATASPTLPLEQAPERSIATLVPMRRAYSPHTAWAWALVLSPVWLAALIWWPRWFDLAVMPGVISVRAMAALVALAVFVGAVSAYCDVQRLRRAGFPRPAHWFWILLGPLGYLIARSVRVHAATGRGWTLVRFHAYTAVLVAALLTAAVLGTR